MYISVENEWMNSFSDYSTDRMANLGQCRVRNDSNPKNFTIWKKKTFIHSENIHNPYKKKSYGIEPVIILL